MYKFSDRLDVLIKTNKTKKKDLAAAIGLTPSAVTEMVKDRSNPSLSTIRSIANYYHVSEEWLEYGTGEVMEPGAKVSKIHRVVTPEEEALLQILESDPEVREAVKAIVALSERKRKTHVNKILKNLKPLEE